MQRKEFYHRLRLIFTYYASLGHKESPLILREKNFQKLIIDSSIGQLFNNNENAQSPIKNVNQRRKRQTKPLQVLINSFNKPISFKEFDNVMVQLIQKLRRNKDEQTNWSLDEEEQLKKDFFDLCRQEKMILKIFNILYEQILQNTEFGRIVLFSSEKSHFDEHVFRLMKKNENLLTTVYFHHFDKATKDQAINLDRILMTLKMLMQQFEVIPQKLSLTQVFICLWQVLESKSKSVYELQFQRSLMQYELIQQKEWKQFSFVQFTKLLILVADLVSFKQTTNNVFEFTQRNMVDFLQLISISKGYKALKSLYKFKEHFYQLQAPKKDIIKTQNVFKFSFKKIEQITPSILLLHKLERYLTPIFGVYTNKKETKLMSAKGCEFLMREFKAIPQLISKEQVDQIYMRVFLQRQFYTKQEQKINISKEQNFSHDSTKKTQKQTVLKLIQNPQFGLTFEQFKKLLLFLSETENVCKLFTPFQRLIYCLQHFFRQPKFKAILDRQINTERTSRMQIDCSNPKSFIVDQIKNDSQLLGHFQNSHKLMYKKLKHTLK